ncbi:MAG: SpoIIE family protein phosphatase [Polyangiaceae bacterium]|nr:SpoIIE family protein phosphatase [Polyangiaceae bacterium]
MNRNRYRIGLLVDSLSSEYTALIWRAAMRAATERGVETMTFVGERLGAPRPSEATQNRIYELVSAARVDGAILVSSVLAHNCGEAGIRSMCQRLAPLPTCSVGMAVEGVPSLIVDNSGGMELGTAHLLDVHRCRRIAFIAAEPGVHESELRLQGFRRAHADRGLSVDERLIDHGDFTMVGGTAAMRRLMSRGIEFDAVLAANDYMALAAVDVLRAHGRKVPGDVLVSGFDDISVAPCARPSLSTLRQPIWWLAGEAVRSILSQLDGEEVAPLASGAIELVRRESCGCGMQAAESVMPVGPRLTNLREAIVVRRAVLEKKLDESVFVPQQALGNWPRVLLDALEVELGGEVGHFTATFEQYLDRALRAGVSLDEFQRMITTLRSELRRVPIANVEEYLRVERIWHTMRIMVGAASVRSVGRDRLEAQRATASLGRSGERFATTLSLPLLKEAMLEELPGLEIEHGAVSLFEGGSDADLVPLLVMREGRELSADRQPFARDLLAPDAALTFDNCFYHSVVLPLSFETDFLGVAVLSSGAVPGVYESIRQQIGAAIKGAYLHRQVVAQVAARERLEQGRVSEETRMAAEIQTSMAPASLAVAGLELAHVMIPAAEAGGDYADVLPHPNGAWFAIGDVSGHGLGAGLIMLMLQSMVSSLVRHHRQISPTEVVLAVNEAIYENVRHRLRRDDHATLTVFRYERTGQLWLAGYHEPLVVFRAGSGKCEIVTPPGFWVGAIPDVRDITEDTEIRLRDRDLLVLYTDGVTEARNPHHEQFGLERLVSIVEARHELSVTSLRDEIVNAVRTWSSSLDDDVTLLIARYRAEPAE